MDHIDREILQILQHNARASLKMIAEKTFLSSPAAKGRAAGKWQQKSPAHRTREDGPVSPLPGSGLPPVLILNKILYESWRGAPHTQEKETGIGPLS